MPIYKIGHNTTGHLLSKPESGMGYQIIKYRDSALVIFNATIAIPLDELRTKLFTENDYLLLSGDPGLELKQRYEPMDILDDILIIDLLLGTGLRTDTFGLSFTESVTEPPESVISSKVPHSYYRYSPYFKDKRVDSITGNYLPGTFATTYADMHFVPSGFAAVGRYALPNPASAQHVFPIVTLDKPNLIGTATPNFGQAGGGVEVLFKNGAKNYPGNSFQINAG